MTVRQNVSYPLRARGPPRRNRHRVLDDVLEGVRCSELGERYPSQLSGGQQQRIALARALVAEPRVMLLDEPLSNLDAPLRLQLRQQLREVHRQFGFTAVFVTHDQSEAMHVGTRVALMRDGELEQVGRPREIYDRPASPYAARFPGRAEPVHHDSRRFGVGREHWCAAKGAADRSPRRRTARRGGLSFRVMCGSRRCPRFLLPPTSSSVRRPSRTSSTSVIESSTSSDATGPSCWRRGRNDDPTLAIGVQVIASTCADQALLYVDGRLVDPVRSGSPPRHTLQSAS